MESSPSFNQKQSGLWQLSPFFVFVTMFCLLHGVYYTADTAIKSGFALVSCLIALIVSLGTFPKKMSFNKKIALFVEGSAQPTILYMCYIFIFSSVFTHIVDKIGGIQAAVNLGLTIIPPGYILPGLFTVISLFALTIGSSMGSIAAFMPIAIGFADKLSLNPSLVAGLVVGASMLGDNLSVISDTTIAATQTTGSKMRDKFRENALLVLPAFIATCIVLTLINATQITALDIATTYNSYDFVHILPYATVFVLALLGLDVLAVLIIGALVATGIGIGGGSFTFLQATSFLFEGFYVQTGMVNVFILVLLIAGLARIIEHNGGIDYLLRSWQKNISSSTRAEIAISLLVFLVNAAVAINTVAILITGPIAKKIGDSFSLRPSRIASLLDIAACTAQGLIPYTPQLLLAGAIAHVSSVSIMPYLHYQFFIGISALISILRGRKTKKTYFS